MSNNRKICLGDIELTQSSEVEALNSRVSTIEGITPLGKAINTTYANLKSLRDNSQLVPGQFYRITDYVTTTTQADSRSAGHVFDVIVRADDGNVLNENAYAAKQAGDTYFTNSKLEAWKLKYCLDNDTDRFLWADTTNGKGVIYYMKDEWNNECPYDFKNIQFNIDAARIYMDAEDGDTYYCYTFSLFDNGYADGDSILDESVVAKSCMESDGEGRFGNNTIKPHFDSYSRELNFIVFATDWTSNYINHYNNRIGYRTYQNVFRSGCNDNILHNGCNNNTFYNYCSYNTFGRDCESNTFWDNCSHNTFGDNCNSNKFKGDCSYNTFSHYCNFNTFGDDCYYNTFGEDCYNNTFGNSCYYNTFGNSCNNNTFSRDYFKYNIIENGNKYITLTSTQTTSSSTPLRNIKICQGVNNTTTRKTISHNTVNDTFQTEYKPENSVTISVRHVEYGESSSNAISDII